MKCKKETLNYLRDFVYEGKRLGDYLDFILEEGTIKVLGGTGYSIISDNPEQPQRRRGFLVRHFNKDEVSKAELHTKKLVGFEIALWYLDRRWDE